MNRLTTRDKIITSYSRFKYQYRQTTDPGKLTTIQRLSRLDLFTCSAEDVNKTIGNESWTRITCSECENEVDAVTQLGGIEDGSGEDICDRCLTEAYNRIPKVTTN